MTIYRLTYEVEAETEEDALQKVRQVYAEPQYIEEVEDD